LNKRFLLSRRTRTTMEHAARTNARVGRQDLRQWETPDAFPFPHSRHSDCQFKCRE